MHGYHFLVYTKTVVRTSTKCEVKLLQEHVAALTDNKAKELDIIKLDAEHMATFTATTTKRLDNVDEMFKEHHAETQAFSLQSSQCCTLKHTLQTHPNPRFLAQEVGGMEERESDGLMILKVCCGSPIRRNSVLEGLKGGS